MPKEKITLRDLLAKLKPYDERRDRDFDVVPGWDGVTIEALTDAAVLLVIRGENYWLPLGQLRSTMQDDVYASMWILGQKGLS